MVMANAAPKDAAMHCHGCCEKPSGKSGDDKDGKDCQGMQAVKFNLLEKQTADAITSGELPVLFISTYNFSIPVVVVADRAYRLPEQWAYKHSPPDLQVLHQLFLI